MPRGRMLDAMERSAIKLLKRRGLSQVRIGEVVGRHRTTVATALHEPAEVRRQRQRTSRIDSWGSQIETWLSRKTPVRRMWELVRAHDPPYPGSRSAFYAGVSRIRAAVQRAAIDAAVRFEGLPGEYLQVDWGEVRRMPFARPDLREATRYFFAARLKHSR